MSTQQVREALAELEREAQEATDDLLDTETQAGMLLLERTRKDKALQQKRLEIKQAREELDRQERLEASRQQSQQVRQDALVLAAKFERLAEGHLWYEGILPHQWTGIMFGAVADRWILGDEMGLGKTRQSIGWLDVNKAKKVIVVTPAEICDQWAGEAMTLAPHRTVVNLYKKTPARRHELMDEAMAAEEGLIVVNYEIWRRDKDILAKLISWRADTVIVDEAHALKSMRTSNFKSIRTLVFMDNVCPKCKNEIKGLYEPLEHRAAKAVLRPCPTCGWKKGEPTSTRYANRLDDWLKSKSVRNVLLTTGTPILNDPGDLFPLLHLCDPILFDREDRFRKTYCTKNYHSDKWEFRPHAIEKLKPLISGRFKARTYAEAGVEIPPQQVHIIPVDLDKRAYPLQHRTIQQITKASQIVLDNGKHMTIMHLMALITRKRQANVWPAGIQIIDKDEDSPRYGEVLFSVGDEVQESAKLDAVQSQIESFEPGTRQVVFSQFKTALAELERRLTAAGHRVVRFDGDTDPALRAEIKTNFNRANAEEPKWDILLCNYKTGGVGLNLTEITKTHILDEEWNPGKRDQAYKRTARMGQTDETEVFVYRMPKTVDVWMAALIRHKESIVGEFNGAMIAEESIDFRQTLTDILREEDQL